MPALRAKVGMLTGAHAQFSSATLPLL